MKGARSPVFTDSDDDDLGPGERWASDPVLGRGYFASAQLKLAILRLHRMFESDQLRLRPRDRKKVPRGNVARVAEALGISPTVVQATVTEKNKTGKVADPDPRGPAPTDWDDYAPSEGFALVPTRLYRPRVPACRRGECSWPEPGIPNVTPSRFGRGRLSRPR